MPQLDAFNLNNTYSKPKLDIETKGGSKGVYFDISSSQLPDTKLDLKSSDSTTQELKLGLLHSDISEPSTETKISGVFAEIYKEGEIESIENKISTGYVSLKSQHLSSILQDQNKHLEEFKKTQSFVDSWFTSRDRVKSAKPLTQSQRISLQKVYELYDALKNKRDSLKAELKKYSDLPELQALAQKSGAPSLSTIQSSLTTIDWQGGAVKVQKDTVGNRFFNPQNWGIWSKNPYKVFYDSERNWRNDIRQSNKNAGDAYKIEQSIARLNSTGLSWAPRFRRHIEDDTKKLNELRSQLHSHIELQVAHKLLRYMNAPKN